jgi:hypothetical protein
MNYRKEAQKLIDLTINVDRHVIDTGTPEGRNVRRAIIAALASAYDAGDSDGMAYGQHIAAPAPVPVDVNESEATVPESDVLLVDDLIQRVRFSNPYIVTRQHVINRLQGRAAAAPPSNELAMWRLIGEVLIDKAAPDAAHDLATTAAGVLLNGSKL